MLKKHEMAGRKLYIVLVDLEKASDLVPRKMIDFMGTQKKGCDEERSIVKNKDVQNY